MPLIPYRKKFSLMGDVGRLDFLGFIVSRDSFMNRLEVVQRAEEGKLEVSYRWFRTCKNAEGFCFRITNE